MDILKQLKEELNIRREQVEAAVKLIDEGNTIPFIARYRKEATGSLDDEQLRNLNERLQYLRNLEDKKTQVINSIKEQGKMTEELKAQILAATTLVVVEDLYRPYRPKRRTRATIAKEKGLEELATIILTQDADKPVEEYAKEFLSQEKEVNTVEEAITGAMDIIAEDISDEAQYRSYIRDITTKEGKITSVAKDEKQESVYEMYYNFEESIDKLAGHRVLAINRGEKEKVLTVKVLAPEERILRYLETKVIVKDNAHTNGILKATIEDSYKRLIAPAIEREIRNELTEKAEDGAIKVFGKNLVQLLMAPPITGQVVLGWDPAFRTGCKLAVVDSTGKVLDTVVIYPTPPQNKVEEAKRILKNLIDKYNITLISVGNGTASRESEMVIVDLLKEIKKPIFYVIVNEAGASVYSASKLATEEFPNFDVGQRSAASIARRLQDPLAELVKIEPQSIGVGQYQHDMNQKKLSEVLAGVVEDCVNKVGVDLNTASVSLLEHVSGVSKVIAKNIVAYREANGRFHSREELLKVSKLGPKAYEQCAGFMRIQGGDNPLDATGVHPESYEATKVLLSRLGLTLEDIKEIQAKAQKNNGTEKVKTESKPVKRQEKKKPVITVKSQTTTFGKALAAAVGQGIEAEMKDQAEQTVLDQSRQDTVPNKDFTDTSFIGKKITNKNKMAEELGIGEITLMDIIKELEKPGRDPRDEMPKPILRTDVLEMKDLTEGMILKGTVRNVIDFGAFVDIGVHQDGLVHISQLSDKKFVKHPLDVVSVGDIVEVKVLSVDLAKKRIQLTMKL
ncbi:RNA-binding transcriptional accessory protein [Mobilitalea sibirica]|uniref:RNA-binding transcriptional accessory protein n=1 Tax=Mobilitalea sibirica TaxID=1462919 RepID=A0A8J7HDS6_9FIRM|nr:Tex family protein [Mobilitalea sibirica]MBH1942427.1 RNA-binding transcriptional accessory protein [Mobilitalea sibirica]